MPSDEELRAFLTEARRNTGQKNVTTSLWTEWRRRSHNSPKSSLIYTSQSLGYLGRTESELVSLGTTPIWASNTVGGITDLNTLPERTAVHAFLKGRMIHLQTTDASPRDGHRFDANFRYVNREHGTLAEGYGEEALFYDVYLIYRIHFRHGLIR